MVNQNILFPLLQFVALVAPAIAVILQLLEDRGDSDEFAFKLLEGALVAILFGTVLLLLELIQSLDSTVVIIGSSLVFLSLLLTSIAIGWETTSLSDSFAEATGNSPSYLTVSYQLIKLSVVVTPSVIIFGATWYLFDQFLSNLFNLGPIREIEAITPSIFFLICLATLFIRSLIYFVDTGKIPVKDLNNQVGDALGNVFAIILVFLLMSTIPYLIFFPLTILKLSVLPISPSSPIFILSYIWVVLVVVILFASNFGEEKDDTGTA